ncbi:NADase-type glycan-binding domain-containing protein [Agromyces salentinus]|uniref:NADase-type glycan-binding domain-containing protein n=1 Tax=Agromyces salentinus TaxID=269421 RepID=UPI0012F92E52|nr:hypothetical protein [Agromyces salentinus]
MPTAVPPTAIPPSVPKPRSVAPAKPTATTPKAVAPAARKPSAVPQRPARRQATPADAPKPGDLVCPNCGAGNAPGRHFCRRCAAALEPEPDRSHPVSHQAAIGTRPKRRRRFRYGWIVVVVLIAGLASLAWFLRSPISGFFATAADRVVDSSAYNPVGLGASSSAEGRGPELAHDGFSDRSWAPAPTGPATGESLSATFDTPFRLVAVQVSSGASAEQAAFLAEARPSTMLVTTTDAAGVTRDHTLKLADEPGPQRFDLGVDDVVAVQMTIQGAFGATDATHVAIAEVEFFGR